MSEAAEYLSASRITLYTSCPRKYSFRYVEKIPVTWKAAALAFGSAVHSALESVHNTNMAGGTPAVGDVVALFRSDWAAQQMDDLRFKDGEDAASLATMGEGLIRSYLEAYPDSRVAAVELPFEVPLIDPATGEVIGPNLKGVFDLILEGDRIVELKTAARGYDEGTLARHIQLTAYHFAYGQRFGREPTLEVRALLKLKKPRVDRYEAIRTVEDDAWFVHVAAEVQRGIDAGIFPPAPSFLCGDCEYAGPCRSWRGPTGANTKTSDVRMRLPIVEANVALAV